MKQLFPLRVKVSVLLIVILLVIFSPGTITPQESNNTEVTEEINSTSSVEDVSPQSVIYGDVTGNSKVAVEDAIKVLRYVTGLVKLSSEQKVRADVNKNDKVDVNDAIIILRHLVGIIDSLPYTGNDDSSSSKPGEDPQSDPNPEPEPRPDPVTEPSTKYSPNHRVKSDGILYGLDYWKNEVHIASAPRHLDAGDYLVKDDYHFFLIDGDKLIDKGKFNYLERVPYAVMNLDQRADGVITSSFLESSVASRNSRSPFTSMGDAFIESQETWGVNALYLISHAALESAWGLSKIAQDKNNLFGYKAYDSDPYNFAGTFRNMEECIMYLGGYIRKAYLSEGGRWFNGPNLEGMNVFYATDPMWKIKIARIMNSLLAQEKYKPVIKKYNKGKVVNIRTHLNLRSGPGTSYSIVGTLSNNLEVDILGKKVVGSINWYKVNSKAGIGWVSGEFIELQTDPSGAVYITDWYMVDKNPPPVLNVRSGVGTSNKIIDKIEFAQKVTVKDIRMSGSDAWYRISYSSIDKDTDKKTDKEGWVNSKYVIVKW